MSYVYIIEYSLSLQAKHQSQKGHKPHHYGEKGVTHIGLKDDGARKCMIVIGCDYQSEWTYITGFDFGLRSCVCFVAFVQVER